MNFCRPEKVLPGGPAQSEGESNLTERRRRWSADSLDQAARALVAEDAR